MKLPVNGKKKQYVERLMVHIFELEPLQQEEKEKAEDDGKKSVKGTKKKKSKKDDEKSAKSSKKKKVKTTPVPKGSWVAPPLETIKKGGYDSKTGLNDNFNLTDLAKYCKDKGIPPNGKKTELIRKIITYLDTGSVETKSPKRKKPEKAKTEKAEKPKPEKAEKAEKPEKVETPEKVEKPEKEEKAEKAEKPEKGAKPPKKKGKSSL